MSLPSCVIEANIEQAKEAADMVARTTLSTLWTEAEMKILRDSQKVRPVVWLFYCPTYQS